MSQPIESLACVANTPAQAKMFVAMLAAEGIPARVDGDSLADEVASSQRLMNLVGTRVMVPTSALQRAQELLQPLQVDPHELVRQALAEAPEFPHDRSRANASAGPATASEAAAAAARLTRTLLLTLLVSAIGAAVLFALLWRREVNRFAGTYGDARSYWSDDVLCEERISDQKTLRRSHDKDRDGLFERFEFFGNAATPLAVYDQYSGGIYNRCVETHADGMTATWTDEDRDGQFDICVVTDREGEELQTLRWVAGTGLVLQPK
jgi:hypothetical protein